MAKPPVAIIGGGAAGIIAAWRAAQVGADVTIYEKTGRLGTKILISGGGKCNITHAGDLEHVLKAFRSNEARFIRPACYRFTNEDIIDLLTSRGLRVYTREDGRIFPVDQTAKDVVRILEAVVREVGVRVRLNTPVKRILRDEAGISGIDVGEVVPTRHLVLTTGGSSFPNSGTTGDGWPWALELGHSLVTQRAALAPLITDPEPLEGFAGIALRDVVLKSRQSGKEIARWRGDMLFTHHGLSGPTVLGISRVVAEKMEVGACTVEVDLFPDDSFEAMQVRLAAILAEESRKMVRTVLDRFVPARLATHLAMECGVDPAMPVMQLTKKNRNRLIEVLKGWALGGVREVVLERGEVVAGGVSLDEVDPHSMRSRVVPGLYLAGEVLDVAGPVGGYNLQAAWATGYVAGETAAMDAIG